jgi:hypothetical protein
MIGVADRCSKPLATVFGTISFYLLVVDGHVFSALLMNIAVHISISEKSIATVVIDYLFG